MNKIPKIIHYCWFGGNPLNDKIKKNIESWKNYNPTYEIVEWNEKNCDISSIEFVHQAYKEKKWAFVSDYFRVKKIQEIGGFYMDTDMECTSSFDDLLFYDCICGFEMLKKPFSAFFAAKPGHVFVNDMVNYYEKQRTFIPLSNTTVFSKLLILNSTYKCNFLGADNKQ